MADMTPVHQRSVKPEHDTRTPALQRMSDWELKRGVELFTQDGKPRLLDLFCGAGGAAVGYARAGFEVVGVDIKPQPRYPFMFIRADALEVFDDSFWILGGIESFDAIHASPPCQGYHSLGDGAQLIAETRELLDATGLPYVIENIPEARWALRDPVLICGTMFDPPLDGLKRHRLFESNVPLKPPAWPCRHKLAAPRFRVYEHGHWYLSPFVKVYGSGGGKAREHWPAAMGIDWMTDAELVEAIPPTYAQHIGEQLYALVTEGVKSGH